MYVNSHKEVPCMKIFHVAGGGDRGGAKTHILALCSRLKERYDLTLVSLRSGDFPDLFTAYPRVAEGIGEELLTDWNEIYSEEELSVFVDDFLAEGNISGRQLTLPIAKSTELLFVNKTLFDRFANESGF